MGRYKLIEFYDTGRAELYDLHADLGETTDLAGKMPERAAALRKALHDWRKRVGASAPPPTPRA